MSTTNKPLLLVDCDGVLLKWTHYLEDFLKTKNMDTSHLPPILEGNPMVSLDVIFRVDTHEEVMAMFSEYNHSHYTRQLPVFEPAAPAVMKRLSEIFDIEVITNISDEPGPAANRRENLMNVYGPVFSDVHCMAFGSNKTAKIRELAQTREVALWIDDQVSHVKEGLAAGVPSVQYSYDMICGRNTGEVPEMPSWLDVERHLNRRYNRDLVQDSEPSISP